MFSWEDIQAELRELKAAWKSAAVVALALMALTWYTASQFYAERFAVLEQRLQHAQENGGGKGSETEGRNPTPRMRNIISTWGAGAPERCHVTADVTKLAEYAERYSAILLCGFPRADRDRVTDQDVTVSAKFTIEGGMLGIDTELSASMRKFLENKIADGTRNAPPVGASRLVVTVPLWYEIAVIPKSLDVSAIRSIADVERFGGQRFPDDLRQIVATLEKPLPTPSVGQGK